MICGVAFPLSLPMPTRTEQTPHYSPPEQARTQQQQQQQQRHRKQKACLASSPPLSSPLLSSPLLSSPSRSIHPSPPLCTALSPLALFPSFLPSFLPFFFVCSLCSLLPIHRSLPKWITESKAAPRARSSRTGFPSPLSPPRESIPYRPLRAAPAPRPKKKKRKEEKEKKHHRHCRLSLACLALCSLGSPVQQGCYTFPRLCSTLRLVCVAVPPRRPAVDKVHMRARGSSGRAAAATAGWAGGGRKEGRREKTERQGGEGGGTRRTGEEKRRPEERGD